MLYAKASRLGGTSSSGITNIRPELAMWLLLLAWTSIDYGKVSNMYGAFLGGDLAPDRAEKKLLSSTSSFPLADPQSAI